MRRGQELPTPNAPALATLDEIQMGGSNSDSGIFQRIDNALDTVHGGLQRGPGVCQDESESRAPISDPRVPTEHAAPSSEAQATPVLHKFGLQELLIPCHGFVEPERMFTLTYPKCRVQLWDTIPPLPCELTHDLLHDTTYSFTAFRDHYSLGGSDYLEVTFTERAQLYVLLEAGSKIPEWLVREFRCLTWCALRANSDALDSSRRPEFSLVVWQRKHQCMPGVRYVLGAPQGKQGRGYTYLLAWQKLGQGEEVEEPPRRMSLEYEGPQHYPEGMTGGLCTERSDQAADEYTEAPSKKDMLAEVEGYLRDIMMFNIANLALLTSMVEVYRELVDYIKLPFWVTVNGEDKLLVTVMPPSALLAFLWPEIRRDYWEALMYLVVEGAEIDVATFRVILQEDVVCHGYSSMQHFVLSYLVRHRNPVAAAMVFAQELTAQEARSTGGKAKEWRELAIKLRAVAVELLGHLDTDERALHAVLQPMSVIKSVSEASPVQIAFDTVDLDFMSAPAIQGLMWKRWIAEDRHVTQVHPRLASELESVLKQFREFYSTPFRDVNSLVELISLGRVRNFSETSIIWNGPRFFESPRGRWVFKLFLEGFFLYVYHHVLLMTDEFRLVWQHVVLVLYIAGMVVDEVQELIYQYHGCLTRYYSNGFNVVEALLVAMLVTCAGLKVAMWGLPGGQDNPRWEDICTAKELLYSTASILVWSRILQYLIPLYEGFGSLLMIINLMIREVLKFALPGVVLMFGVGFSFFSVFRSHVSIPELSTFPLVLVQLFRTFVGESMFGLMDEEHNQLYNLYGNILAMLFTLMATVVMANLLIALMSYHYKPEQFAKQSRFQAAEQLHHYEYMVERHLLGAPFSLPLLLLSWLPSGTLENGDGRQYPTGTKAIPYLVYLLTMHPVLMVMYWAVHVASTPYCVIYFTFRKYRNMIRDDSTPTPATAQEQDWRRATRWLSYGLLVAALFPATLPFWLAYWLPYYVTILWVALLVMLLTSYAVDVTSNIFRILVGWGLLGRVSSIWKRGVVEPAARSLPVAPKPSSDPPESQSGTAHEARSLPAAPIGGSSKPSDSLSAESISEGYIPGRDARGYEPVETRWRFPLLDNEAEKSITLRELELALRNAGFTKSEVALAVEGRLSPERLSEVKREEKQVDWGVQASVWQVGLETRREVKEQLAQMQEEQQKAMEKQQKEMERQHARTSELQAAVADLRRLAVMR
ncbi:hypothetical protein Agub_g13130 [Astrephomene gubernaculifera]|uniref:Ion transport domain-containing protein n=1 Tax=Astrephomene gubernaculifera TaxID=47775 RepID=A0AAD3DZH4_9CHLO|nr:hypothetical protein Agub_g13130 [Astrephomene gubernaculifera]